MCRKGIGVDHSHLSLRLKRKERLPITCQCTIPQKSLRVERSQWQISLICKDQEGLGITQTLKEQKKCLGRNKILSTIQKEIGIPRTLENCFHGRNLKPHQRKLKVTTWNLDMIILPRKIKTTRLLRFKLPPSGKLPRVVRKKDHLVFGDYFRTNLNGNSITFDIIIYMG